MPEDFRPAWFCPGAVHFLLWSETALGWELHHDGQLIGKLPGYPIGARPNSPREAVAWATAITGPQQWIQRPRRAGVFHTHHNNITYNIAPKEN